MQINSKPKQQLQSRLIILLRGL